jgi:hypothetical protein
LAEYLHKALGIANGEPVVQLALEQLGRRNLLLTAVNPLPLPARCSRRDALKKLAVAVAALPLVLTCTPKAAAAAGGSVKTTSGECLVDSNCIPAQFGFDSDCADCRCVGADASQVPLILGHCECNTKNEGGVCRGGANRCRGGKCVPVPNCTGECTAGTGNCSPGCKCPPGGNGKCVPM